MNKTKIRATEQPIAVDIEGLSAMLSCGRATARKIGEQAGAKIVIGRRAVSYTHLDVYKRQVIIIHNLTLKIKRCLQKK